MNNQVHTSIQIITETFSELEDIQIDKLKTEDWNGEYGAYDCIINNQPFKARLAKKTPKKSGYFLALWKKDESNKNIPFNETDIENKLIISIQDESKIGQFVFPKKVLIEKGILQSKRHKGKMAFRIYPIWETSLNKTAKKSQAWQKQYFINLGKDVTNGELYNLYFE